MTDAGVDERFILIDKQSGKDFNSPQYQLLKHALREGDLLIIKSIDRLGRNYKEIMKEWQEITVNIRADIRVLDINMLDTTLYKGLLGTFISNLVLQVLAYVAEHERENIRQRQAEGIALAKAQGRHLGRPKVKYPSNWLEIYMEWRNNAITAKVAMERLNMKRTTFYKLVAQYEQIQA